MAKKAQHKFHSFQASPNFTSKGTFENIPKVFVDPHSTSLRLMAWYDGACPQFCRYTKGTDYPNSLLANQIASIRDLDITKRLNAISLNTEIIKLPYKSSKIK